MGFTFSPGEIQPGQFFLKASTFSKARSFNKPYATLDGDLLFNFEGRTGCTNKRSFFRPCL